MSSGACIVYIPINTKWDVNCTVVYLAYLVYCKKLYVIKVSIYCIQ